MPAYQGNYFAKGFKITQAVGGAVVDITNWAFKMELRAKLGDAAPAVTLTTAGGGLVTTDATSGRVEMRLTAVQTAALSTGKYLFDVQRTDANPGPVWLFGGTLFVKQPVTR